MKRLGLIGGVTLALIVMLAVFPVSGSTAFAAYATISASPNPVSVAAGSTGTSTLRWNTGTGAYGQVYYSANGSADRYFLQGASGAITVTGFAANTTYVFKLYAGTTHVALLASTRVTTYTPTTTAPPPVTSPPPTSSGSCPGSASACMQAVLTMLNHDRSLYGVAPLALSSTLSYGNGSCIGAYGHSVHMGTTGVMSHDQFPADICGAYSYAGENVGYASYGSELTDLQWMNSSMMAENSPPKVPGCSGSHACNIINPAFHQVGIGIYMDASGRAWLTEDFMN